MIHLIAAIILATVDVDAHHGSKDIESNEITAFFRSGVKYTCDAVNTFGAKSHSKDVIKRFAENTWDNEQWRTSLYAPYAAWYERVYYGNCGPSNDWTEAEFGGTMLPNISWNLGMNSDWAYVYRGPRGTNYYPHVLTPNVTRRLTEWESLMGLQDGVREFCDGREAGTPIMTRGRYWRGGDISQGYAERRIYWSSQHLIDDENVISVNWTNPRNWNSTQNLSLKFMPVGALLTGWTDMHRDRFYPTASSMIPPRAVAEKISRTYPNGLSADGYGSIAHTFEENISLHFGLNESGCTNPLRYNNLRLRRIVNDYYGMYEDRGPTETNFGYYSSNVAAASRALAMLDRTYEIVNEKNISSAQLYSPLWNNTFECEVTGYCEMTNATPVLLKATEIKHNSEGKLYLKLCTESEDDIRIQFPEYTGTPTINVETNSSELCDARWDYAWCGGASLAYEDTMFSLQPGTMLIPSMCRQISVVDIHTLIPICPGGTNTLYALTPVVRGNEHDDLLHFDFLIDENRTDICVGQLHVNVEELLNVPFDVSLFTKVKVNGGYNYSYSMPVTQPLVERCWNYAGPSSLAYDDGRVEGARMHYGAGVYSQKYVDYPPRMSNLTYDESWYGLPYSESCAMFANRGFSSMLGWRQHLLDIRQNIRERVFSSINSWYSAPITSNGGFLDPIWGAVNWNFANPYAIWPIEKIRNLSANLHIKSSGYSRETGDVVDVVYALMEPRGTCANFMGYVNGELVGGLEMRISISIGSPVGEIHDGDVSYTPPTVKRNLPNSWSSAADSKNAIVIETDWKWKILGWCD